MRDGQSSQRRSQPALQRCLAAAASQAMLQPRYFGDRALPRAAVLPMLRRRTAVMLAAPAL